MNTTADVRFPWNKGKLIGQKRALKPKDIWAMRVRLEMEHRVRELALFNLAFDSKLRGCDLVALRVRDVCHGDRVATRAMVMQSKTQRPVQFEITPVTRSAVEAWIRHSSFSWRMTPSMATPAWRSLSTKGCAWKMPHRSFTWE